MLIKKKVKNFEKDSKKSWMKIHDWLDQDLTVVKIKRSMFQKILKSNLMTKFKSENLKLNCFKIDLLLLKALIENIQVQIH